MGKIPPTRLQEIVLGSSDKAASKRIKSFEKQQLLKKIAPRIYTSNLEENPETIIRRNWFRILAHQYPGALLSHRSALEFKPTPSGHVYATYTYTGNVQLPGLTIHFLKGPGKTEGDSPFFENLYASQETRAFLENMQETRKAGEESKTLSKREVEERLEMIIRARGEKSLNAIRDRAKELAPVLKMDKEFKDKNNRAGSTEFVDRQLVAGTLKKGFEWYTMLRHPFARAAYMVFLVSEVHPFLDGNGRIARVMMNAELSSKGLSKIIIPTVYREDYIGAIKKLSRQRVADAYIRMLSRAYEFSATVNGDNIDSMEQFLTECDAFKEPKEGKLKVFQKNG